MITNQKELRRAFWQAFEDDSRITKRRGRDGDYLTDTRVAWCDWIESLSRDGTISEALAQRATLDDGRADRRYADKLARSKSARWAAK